MVWLHAMPHQHGPADMTEKRLIEQGLSVTKFYGYCLEDAPNGIRKPNDENYGRPTIKHIHFDGNGVDYVFSNCMCCHRKDFSGDYKTPADGEVPVTYKDSPRLGRCGCVVCTECVLKVGLEYDNDDEWIRCPSPTCMDDLAGTSHHRDEIIWIMNETVLRRPRFGGTTVSQAANKENKKESMK